MNRIKGVIFDWAGTTVDFGCTSPVSAFKEAFRRAGIDVTDEEVRAPMGLLKRDHIKSMLAMPRIAQAWQDKYGAAATDADAEKIYADFEPALMAVLDRHCSDSWRSRNDGVSSSKRDPCGFDHRLYAGNDGCGD